MTTIYVVTYCPPWAEYNSQRSNEKAFYDKNDAQEYINQELINKHESGHDEYFKGMNSDYEIDEIELV